MINTTMTVRATRFATSKASACPGLFRIVPAVDGGLCRLKVPLGRLSASGACAVAKAARRHGSGVIEVTNRANLQLRGVRDGADSSIAADLLAAGLGPKHPDSDDVRNVLVSPMAGLDPNQHLDIRPVATAILDHLETDAGCRTLSPKFSVMVDGGEDVAVLDHPHDLWLAAIDETTFALGIAGCPPVALEDATPFITVAVGDTAWALAVALSMFLDMTSKNPETTRLRHLLPRVSRADFLDRLSKRLGLVANLGDKARRWRRGLPAERAHVGIRNQRQDRRVSIGAVPPLGRLSPDTMRRLGELAADHGSDLRLTPWQSVMVPDVKREKASRVIETLEDIGLICSPGHPLATTVACAGSAGCAKGVADTKADALLLADAHDAGWLHLSGCERSCASPGVADVTLLAAAPGTYDLFVKDARSAHRFGRRVAEGLTVEQARERVRQAR